MNSQVAALPVDASGDYETSRFNALKHGLLSRYAVLPWEDEAEYQALVNALVAEHAPQGPTEEHLVEELAGILWRKRRLRLAEGAVYRRGLKDALKPYSETTEAALVHLDAGEQTERTIEAIRATPEETRQDLKELGEDRAMTEKALKLLRAGKPGAYEKALETLHPGTLQAWKEQLEEWEPDDYEEGQEPYATDAASLQRYLETEICPWYETRHKELENRPLIHAQAFGEALDPDRLQGLARYEVHLDRKLERTLAMLIKLQDLRRSSEPN
jgi:hypothetical protein